MNSDKTILIVNKSDLGTKNIEKELSKFNPIYISIMKETNVDKLISKYNELAREALSNGDKILSENYYQYADHFLRISTEQKEKQKEKSPTQIETN